MNETCVGALGRKRIFVNQEEARSPTLWKRPTAA